MRRKRDEAHNFLLGSMNMNSNTLDIVAVVAPLSTLLAGLGGIWLGQRFAADKEVRDVRRETYRRILRYIATFPNRASDANRAEDAEFAFEELMREVVMLKADLELDGSQEVSETYETYTVKLNSQEFREVLDAAHDANQKKRRDARRKAEEAMARGDKPPRSRSLPPLFEYQKRIRDFMEPEWEALVSAMKNELDP